MRSPKEISDAQLQDARGLAHRLRRQGLWDAADAHDKTVEEILEWQIVDAAELGRQRKERAVREGTRGLLTAASGLVTRREGEGLLLVSDRVSEMLPGTGAIDVDFDPIVDRVKELIGINSVLPGDDVQLSMIDRRHLIRGFGFAGTDSRLEGVAQTLRARRHTTAYQGNGYKYFLDEVVLPSRENSRLVRLIESDLIRVKQMLNR